MELRQIVGRYAKALEHVDANTTTQKVNKSAGVLYHLGLPSLGEETAVLEADAAWEQLHPGELLAPHPPPRRRRKPASRVEYAYPSLSRTNCDHVFSTIAGAEPEWAIECKFVSFVGDNGKNNDYGVGKMLSPYLKDRGVLHDAARLREHGFSRRVAVMMYSFNYDTDSCDEAERRHPTEKPTIDNIRTVLAKNGAPLHARPVIELVDAILGLRGYLRGPRVQAEFEAWRSPVGGRGTVFGWEIRRPHLEPDYDPRHPW